MTISIIIVTYNNSSNIFNCLKSIYSQLLTCILEIIVIDNASSDNTTELIKNYFPGIKLIENKNNVGFGAAVNIAEKYASGRYLLLLNPDTILRYDFFDFLNLALDKIIQPFIMGCKLLNKEGEVQRSVYRIPTITNIIFESFLPYQYSIKLITKKPKSFCEVDTISGACMVIDRKIYEALGGFDEKFFMYYEDIDFCLRARQAEYKVYYNPEIEVVHHIAGSSWQNMETFFQNIYISKLRFFQKHYFKVYSKVGYMIILLGVLFKIAAYSIFGVILINKRLLQLSRCHIFVLRKLIKNKYNK